ncbi:pathogenesis-related protein PR-1 type-like [Cicer arietinum]|uniref:Pathogenesis-related protein PR-1 type-like n=1 Tax=Cicer arietinum TaxID=3827 RepID=A0A1S2X9K0_CICAR|nr:pathogenesis-related protein PR-1 type-like [Cicer arietinum]
MGSFSLLCVLGLSLIIIGDIAHAQNSPSDYVKAHNKARFDVGALIRIPNVVWDEKVASFARTYANQRKDCQLKHSGNNRYGENIAISTRDINGTEAVKLWVDEKPYYEYYRNKCVDGECLHYTQVVWKKSLRIGCAKVKCNNGGTFVTCNYSPPGNRPGELPY